MINPNKTTINGEKHKFFTSYQRMLTFTINLCYNQRDFIVSGHRNGWDVRYR